MGDHHDVDGLTLDDAEQSLMDKNQVGSLKVYWKQLQYKAQTPQYWAVLFAVWVAFFVVLWLFTYDYMKAPMTCIGFDVMLVALASMAIIWEFTAASGITTVTLIPISVGWIVVVFVATFLGLYNYDTYSVFPQYYDNSRRYSNVVADEPSAAISDAGKITFNPQTRVDSSKSAGLISEYGTLYCVAPVYAAAQQPRIEYWAAGIDCCSPAGDFTCDAANNPKAGGGVVVFDNNGWFSPSRFDYYQKARAKAEATWSLQSVGNPIYIRWVETDDLNYLHNYYAARAVWLIIISSIIAFFVSGLYAYAMWKPM
jgi:hypothetical protein|mmetsp:Transcript_20232/g.32325  ORF Transcript_20232/g.32325 Transcript_20232/m.32325 type:complete len:312 (-) Transcript_20232:35-970(-)